MSAEPHSNGAPKTTTQRAGNLETFEGLKIIDSDTHWSEPYDLWRSRAPRKYLDSVPQVREGKNGEKAWALQDQPLFPIGSGSQIDREGFKMPDSFWRDRSNLNLMENTLPIDLVHEASYEPLARVELLDRQGIWAHVLYPNVLQFAVGHLVHCENRDLAIAVMGIYNDASADFQSAGKGRLFPMAVLPFWNISASIKEAERAKELGLRGVVLPGEPQRGELPDPSDPAWYPLYEALSDLELPINIHIGAAVMTDQFTELAQQGFDQQLWKRHAIEGDARARRAGGGLLNFGNQAFLTNLLVSDLPLRYPKLRWVSVESGIGWIPQMLESIDFLYREEYPGYPDYPGPSVPPAGEMFRRAAYACFWFEKAAPERLLDCIGEENVMWETDFPHNTCMYPNPVERVAENLKSVPADALKKIMQDNAASLYKIPV